MTMPCACIPNLILLLHALLLLPSICLASSSSRTNFAAPPPSLTKPISLANGPKKYIQERWRQAVSLANLEQQVEDYNAEYIASCSNARETTKHRRLIVLPLDDRFNPPMGSFSHQHVQTGDKMSLPPCFWQAIQLNDASVPWLFQVSRIDGVTSPRVELVDSDEITPLLPRAQLEKVVGGPLDFRAPSCYVFLPLWMMRVLGLRPRDVVQVDLCEHVPSGAMAKFRPHSSQFAKDIARPQAVLETELRHYSSLTLGSTIAFDYNGKRYWFDVAELQSAPRGEKQPMIKVQDCDIRTEFLPARDAAKKKNK
ncbi:hypothetical protein MPSEU_000463000 [Mayamaea pseudoterrestris]|nr:hypothetical protein MPSEU_000463000 [Mayamaea pseudoterrestris]